jgi:hypothetical protein
MGVDLDYGWSIRMETPNPVRALLALLVSPSRFVRLAVEHAIAQEFKTNKELLRAYPDRNLPPERRKEFERHAKERTDVIRRALFVAWVSTVLAIILGLLTGGLARILFGKPSAVVSAALQIGAGGIILAATLALLGWEIQSYKGTSLPEKVNRWLFRAQYCLGTTLFVFSFAWAL